MRYMGMSPFGLLQNPGYIMNEYGLKSQFFDSFYLQSNTFILKNLSSGLGSDTKLQTHRQTNMYDLYTVQHCLLCQ
jgi:hypothetical protein